MILKLLNSMKKILSIHENGEFMIASNEETKKNKKINQLDDKPIQDKREFFELCHNSAIIATFETHDKFDTTYNDEDLSPLDLFILNTKNLNILRSNNYSETLGNLLLLGYVSAAESYIRALIRHLIIVDEYIESIIADKAVSYAAASYHKKELLPEALLEDFSLASPHNVFETLKDIIGMKGNRPTEMQAPSKEFMKVCELRHCCVHRFGKLGSKNAIRLGMNTHSPHLEKPVKLSSSDMENVAFIVDNFIRSLNNSVYKYIIIRTADNKNNEKKGEKFYQIDWTWDYDLDNERFRKYYNIFTTKHDASPSMPLEDAYNLFKDNFKPKPPQRKQKNTDGKL